jgi:hypothetical protein
MLVHKPFLTIFTGLCVFGVVCFYIIICLQGRAKKVSASEIRTRAIARARRRKEFLEKKAAEESQRRIDFKELAVEKSRIQTGLKKRMNNGVQNVEASETESDETDDSQAWSGSGGDSETGR